MENIELSSDDIVLILSLHITTMGTDMFRIGIFTGWVTRWAQYLHHDELNQLASMLEKAMESIIETYENKYMSFYLKHCLKLLRLEI